MAEPYLGEVRIFGFNFAPRGWMFCSGQLLPIQQYSALFSILGTFYGGDGKTTFALPNMQGRAPMHWGQGTGLSSYQIGELGGATTETLTDQQLPMHTHSLNFATPNPANPAQRTTNPGPTAYLGLSDPGQAYSDVTTPQVAFSPSAVMPSGGSQPHNNVQPVVALNFCVAVTGIFPSRN